MMTTKTPTNIYVCMQFADVSLLEQLIKNTIYITKAYLKNLQHQVDMEKIYAKANKGQPSAQQYMQNTQQKIPGMSFNGNEGIIQAKGPRQLRSKKYNVILALYI